MNSAHGLQAVWLPPKLFEYVCEASDGTKNSYFLLALWDAPQRKEGTIKAYTNVVAHGSRYNARRHVMVSYLHLIIIRGDVIRSQNRSPHLSE